MEIVPERVEICKLANTDIKTSQRNHAHTAPRMLWTTMSR